MQPQGALRNVSPALYQQPSINGQIQRNYQMPSSQPSSQRGQFYQGQQQQIGIGSQPQQLPQRLPNNIDPRNLQYLNRQPQTTQPQHSQQTPPQLFQRGQPQMQSQQSFQGPAFNQAKYGQPVIGSNTPPNQSFLSPKQFSQQGQAFTVPLDQHQQPIPSYIKRQLQQQFPQQQPQQILQSYQQPPQQQPLQQQPLQQQPPPQIQLQSYNQQPSYIQQYRQPQPQQQVSYQQPNLSQENNDDEDGQEGGDSAMMIALIKENQELKQKISEKENELDLIKSQVDRLETLYQQQLEGQRND